MVSIVIFGTGSSANTFINQLDSTKVKVLFFVDNNKEKHFKYFNNLPVYPPSHLLSVTFNYVIVASQYAIEITKQLLELGVPYEKIIPVSYSMHQAKKDELFEKIFYKKKWGKEGRPRIALINYNFSNYNGFPLYKYMPENIAYKYQVDLLCEKNMDKLREYDVICSSHFDGIYKKEYVNIEMWHGFPIKQMGLSVEKELTNDYVSFIINRSNHTDLIMSYSRLYTTFINACFPTKTIKYKITGMPRNDLLFEKGGFNKLEFLLGKKLQSRSIVFYLPTWRKGKNEMIDSNKSWDRLFGFDDESDKDIIEFTENYGIEFVIKLHPFEYNRYKEMEIFRQEIFRQGRIHLLSDDMLIRKKIHLYELLSGASVLVTDYSSVYIDTLLIDMPVIFAPVDLNEYEQNRGFLLEPYEFLTPGPIVKSFKELKDEILKILNGYDDYKYQREVVRNLTHKYQDNRSSMRVWKEIDAFLTKKFRFPNS
jgi:CDP-glycerol glycerophosphotransferase (TagB/SpsB family)